MSSWIVGPLDDDLGFMENLYHDITNTFLDLVMKPDLFSSDYMDSSQPESLKDVFFNIFYFELFYQNIPMVVLVCLGLFLSLLR